METAVMLVMVCQKNYVHYYLVEAGWCIYTTVILVIIGSDNGLSPIRRQAIICSNAGLLSIRPWGTYSNEILFEIQRLSFKKMHLKMLSAKCKIVPADFTHYSSLLHWMHELQESTEI